MTATAILTQDSMPADGPSDDQFPWELEAAPSVVQSDTWLLSFIDILTLLLALFVLLLAQEHSRNQSTDAVIVEEPVQALAEPAPPPPVTAPRPFSIIQLPALPPVVSPLDTLQLPAPARKQKPVEAVKTKPATTKTEPETRLVTKTVEAAPLPPPVEAAAKPPVNDVLEILRANGLADRIEIQTRNGGMRLDIADSILFAPARITLTDGGLTLLGDLAKTLKSLPWALSVEGHTDNVPIQTPRFPSNWELSAARATVVARELIRNGVRPDRIRAIGYADTLPRESNTTPEGRNKNRRVTFVLELPSSPGNSTDTPTTR